ncbi:MAG: hypothetical protein OXU51_18630 [Candidatus Poribacteria bacterium]|nr:hypothetical protein [Candidatus Poribacteria bacterium]
MFLDKLKHSYVASLPILAICGLVFFPIEGDCGWTYMNDGYSSFSDSHTESHGGGWSLSGSVSAGSSSASASMGPSISNTTAFNGTYRERVADYTGNAYVEASRDEVTITVPVSSSSMGIPYPYWQQLTFEAKVDYGNGDFLQAWVLMVQEQAKKVYAKQVSNPTLTLTINVNFGDKRAETGATWKSGGTLYRTEYSTTITKVIPQAQPSKSVNAYVSGQPEASKRAAVYYISFAGNSYDSADASYTTYDQ